MRVLAAATEEAAEWKAVVLPLSAAEAELPARQEAAALAIWPVEVGLRLGPVVRVEAQVVG